jgi:SAM-dependent methyltransferase
MDHDTWLQDFGRSYLVHTPSDSAPGTIAGNPDLIRIMPFVPVAGTVLELGSGEGAVLAGLSKVGLECVGIESDPTSVERSLITAPAARVVTGDAIEVIRSLSAASFDLVVALNFLEHLPVASAASELLPHVARVLKPGGSIIGLVPNGLSPFSGRGRYWDVTHQTAFTPSSLSQLALYSGLTLRRCWERGPIVHDTRSLARFAAWQVARAVTRGRLLIETGAHERGPLTIDMFFQMVRT